MEAIDLKAYVSVDMEGLPGVVSPLHTSPKGFLHSEARKIMTKTVLAVVDELFKNGFDEVYVADSHWYMANILYEELPENVYLIRGIPRPYSMVYGIDESFDAALFIGYHARVGSRGAVLEHTYSSTYVRGIKINNVEASEYYINALVAGYYNVPVILVAGDDKLGEEVKQRTPWTKYVELKKSITRYAAINPNLNVALRKLRNGIEEAVNNLRKGEIKPLKTKEPVEIEITLPNSGYADIVEYIPGTIRINGTTVKYVAKNIIEAYKYLQATVYMASALDTLITTLLK